MPDRDSNPMTQEEALAECRRRGWFGLVPMVWKGRCELNYAEVPVGGPRLKVRTFASGLSWDEVIAAAVRKVDTTKDTTPCDCL